MAPDERTRRILLASACLLLLRRRQKCKRKRSIWVREIFRDRKTDGDFYNLVPKLKMAYQIRGDRLYVECFRMSPTQVEYLLGLVGPYLIKETTNFREPISSAERLLMTLRFLATGDGYRTISFAYRVGKSTVAEIVPEVCEAIWKALTHLYFQKLTKPALLAIAKDFEIKWNFNNCVGAIDGKHVNLVAPPNSGSKFYNYKGSHSIVLMAACDAHYRFTFVDIGNFGRISDGGVFGASELGRALDTDFCPPKKLLKDHPIPMPHCFVGDEAFPLKTNLMKPYPGKGVTPMRRIFNYRLSRARRCIENAFGILVGRWRCLTSALSVLPENATKIVQATVTLHNFLMNKDGEMGNRIYAPHGYGDWINLEGHVIGGEWRNESNGNGLLNIGHQGSNCGSREAMAYRDSFAEYFMKAGAVDWQYKALE